MKEKFKNVKEFLSDKRNKAIVKLIFWFIFFVLVIIYIRIINSKNNYQKPITQEELPPTITENVKTLNGIKDYNIEYVYNDESYLLNVNIDNNIWHINYDNNDYIYDGNLSLNGEVIDANIDYLLMLEPSKIYKYLLKSDYQYKQENSDKSIKINAKLKLNDFAKENNEEITADGDIIIETIESDKLDGIDIDLTKYCQINDVNCNSLYVKVNF